MDESDALARLAKIIGAKSKIEARIENDAVEIMIKEFTDFDSWYNHAAVDNMTNRMGRIVEAASNQVVAAEDAYFNQIFREMGISNTGYVSPRIKGPERIGINTWEEVYERPVKDMRRLMALAYPEDEALKSAIDRLDAQARTDMALAKRKERQLRMSKSKEIIGYRRVIRPELSEDGVCGLCVVASQPMYKIEELLPIHDRDKCDVLPVTKSDDPGWRMNKGDLSMIYSASEGTGAKELIKVRTRFEEHGELGPVLVNAHHRSKNKRVEGLEMSLNDEFMKILQGEQ